MKTHIIQTSVHVGYPLASSACPCNPSFKRNTTAEPRAEKKDQQKARSQNILAAAKNLLEGIAPAGTPGKLHWTLVEEVLISQ